ARSVERHAHHFNAHPYMAELALGAVARMEAEGTSPEAIQRFKEAVRGPLGSLGDRLIWAGALPTAVLVGLVVLALGAPAWAPPLVFLLVYNAVHLTLRVWAFRTGLRQGAGVVGHLSAARLPHFADRLTSAGLFFVGVFTGMVAVRAVSGGEAESALVATVVGAGALVLGEKLGNGAWRIAALTVVALVSGIFGIGVIS
ncbi:MAG: PTS system mannose/fructose/sorbose family transporter subunit IID, partial [Longimicrobiales bacterium]